MEVEQIIKLMEAVSKYDISIISYDENGVSLTIKKENDVVQAIPAPVPMMMPAELPQMSPMQPMPMATQAVTAQMQAAPAFGTTQAEVPAGNAVTSPLVGTFYAAPSPGAEPFVTVGDAVKKGQVLGIVEAMKLMNEIESEYDGIVKAILIEDGNLVEYGQTMFVIA